MGHYLVNPFDKIKDFLTNDVIDGLLSIVTPIATLAFIGVGIAALMSTDEHSRAKFKGHLWWIGIATATAFMAKGIVSWMKSSF